MRYEVNGKPVWEKLGTHTYTFALAAAREKESSLLLGEAAPLKPSSAAPKSLGELREAFLHDKKTTIKKDGSPLDPHTIRSYELVTREFLDVIRRKQRSQITKQDLKTWMMKLRTGDENHPAMSHNTVRNYYVSIACFLGFCGIDHKKLLPHSERPSTVEKVPECYTQTEMSKFFFVIDDERIALAFEMFLKSGGREQEIANLEWADLDLGLTPTVSILVKTGFRTKTEKSRIVSPRLILYCETARFHWLRQSHPGC